MCSLQIGKEENKKKMKQPAEIATEQQRAMDSELRSWARKLRRI